METDSNIVNIFNEFIHAALTNDQERINLFEQQLMEMIEQVTTVPFEMLNQAQKEQFEFIIELLESIIPLSQNKVYLWTLLGKMYLYLKKYHYATECYLSILEQNTHLIETSLVLSECFINLKEYDNAEKYLILSKQSIETNTENFPEEKIEKIKVLFQHLNFRYLSEIFSLHLNHARHISLLNDLQHEYLTIKYQSYKQPKQDIAQLQELMHLDFEVVAVGFYGRSGSYFLQSLLDNYPNIINIPPSELYLFYPLWRTKENRPLIKIEQDFAEILVHLCDASKAIQKTYCGHQRGLTRLGANQDYCLKLNTSCFIHTLLNILPKQHHSISRRDFFVAIHLAYYYTLHQGKIDFNAIKKRPFIVYQLHSWEVEFFECIFQDFNQSKVLQMVREPIQTMGSHMIQTDPNFTSHSISHCFISGIYYREDLSEKYKGIRLEDLHQNPKGTMLAVANWLGLAWNDCLLESTFAGHQWWNIAGTNQVSGFNKVITAKKHTDLFDDFDRFRLNCLFADRKKAWGYEYSDFYDHDILSHILRYPFKFYKTFLAEAFPDEAQLHQNQEKIVYHFIQILLWYKNNKETLKYIDLIQPIEIENVS